MERKDYLTTGELTQLMGITKHTLFHYDDIGLFQAEIY
ncbi:MAG: MerR family DNA-binding transcriptional regulator [Dorea sp.]